MKKLIIALSLLITGSVQAGGFKYSDHQITKFCALAAANAPRVVKLAREGMSWAKIEAILASNPTKDPMMRVADDVLQKAYYGWRHLPADNVTDLATLECESQARKLK